jgi:hypothetical protein
MDVKVNCHTVTPRGTWGNVYTVDMTAAEVAMFEPYTRMSLAVLDRPAPEYYHIPPQGYLLQDGLARGRWMRT